MILMSWTVRHLHEQWQAQNFYQTQNISVQAHADSLILTFHEYGDLPVVLVVGDKQILVEATLVERNEFETPSEIDYRLLTTHKYLPLSTIAIDNIQGQDWYVLFGALSKHSKIDVIAEELDELVSNTFSVIDALEPLYKFNQKRIEE
jgi:uncharacterized protein YjfI (DUF2170 family)